MTTHMGIGIGRTDRNDIRILPYDALPQEFLPHGLSEPPSAHRRELGRQNQHDKLTDAEDLDVHNLRRPLIGVRRLAL